MADAYIVDAVRSPTGRRKGGLADVHAADLGAHVLKSLVERNGIPDNEYDDVMFGCVDTIGPLAGDIARTAWLAAGLSQEVPGTTIDRQCGSSQQAVHFAAQAVMSGCMDVVVAGGVQTMTQIPISSAMIAAEPMGFKDPFTGSKGWVERYGATPPTQFNSAQMIADKWGFSRTELETFSPRDILANLPLPVGAELLAEAYHRLGQKQNTVDCLTLAITKLRDEGNTKAIHSLEDLRENYSKTIEN